jgi:peptidoglycan/LPS O-acetylase OafA/YrhL
VIETAKKQSSAEDSMVKAKEHLHWLDWLRFTAALMVVVVHARGGNWVEWGRMEEAGRTKLAAVFFAMTRTGSEWVTVFFILSGFLVGGKVLERVANGVFDLRAYAIDRFSRIWVPLVPALFFTAGVALFWGRPVSSFDFIGNLLGLQGLVCDNFAGNTPLWSLAYEIWFYILAGCAAVAVTSRTHARLWAFLGIAVVFLVFTRLQAVFLFCWVLGAASYGFRTVKRAGGLAILGFSLSAAGCVISQIKTATVSVDVTSWAQLVPSWNVATLVFGLGLSLIVPFLARLRPQTTFASSVDRLGGRMAAFSYTLYLTHYPALCVWDKCVPLRHDTLNAFSLAEFAAKVLSCVLFAWLLHLPFEARTATVRKWLKSGK